MTTLAENPPHIEKLEANEAIWGGTGRKKTATFHCLKWDQGQEFEYSTVHTVMDLPPLAGCDLTVIIKSIYQAPSLAPFDSVNTIPDYPALVDRYQIPSGFVLERAHAVTHSFGASSAKDGSQTVWIHFLCTASSSDAEKSEWLQSAVVLKWSVADGRTPSNKYHKAPVTLICFEPMQGIARRLLQLAETADWKDTLQDPYLLLDMVYESWFFYLDESAWKTNDVCREIEKDAFQGTRDLNSSFPGPPVVDLHHAHTVAKNAIFMLEGLDATLRSLDAAIIYHQEISDIYPTIWRATHNTLLHRRELFQATKLRTISVEKRLTNIINLAFNIDAMRNSRITQRDSYNLKALSLVATVFLPISTVASVFSTPFFESSGPSMSPQPGGGKEGGTTFFVNPKVWVLWVISVPITVVLICGWWLWEKRTQPGRKQLLGLERDVERG
ncbi:hypothetical protein MauCBS54593_003541 [Microsporum audouinii]